MKKVVSAHVGGKMFQIEEDAYIHLNNALNAQLNKQDIELKVADGFEQKLQSGKSVITYPDVVDVLYQLGIMLSDYQSAKSFLKNKKLTRQINDKIIAGICSGLAEYFEIDTVIIRIIFVVVLILGTLGWGILAYLILWIIIPPSPRKLNFNSW